MKSMKKILALLLAMTMVMGLVACGNQNEPDNSQTPPNNTQTPDDTPTPTEPKVWDDLSTLDYDGQSAVVYDEVLGEFWAMYQEALAETEDVNKRYVMMAEAEAKMLESGIMVPTQRNGGNYAISRVAPRTISSIGWGFDSDRQHSIVVANEFIKQVDRVEMTAKWAELKGTGEYLAWAKQFLTDKGYTLSDTYNYVYTSDPQTWDILATYYQTDAEPIVQTFDNLVEYDNEDTMQPALAESWEVSEDGKTWTFHIRQGVKWYDQQGREIADVKADDWVAGFQHLLDAEGGLEGLVVGVVEGATEYLNKEIDFEDVGVKALDDYTLEYTLCERVSYFDTMLGYGMFVPLCRSFYESQGGKFGKDPENGGFDPTLDTYTYGKGPSSIAYCGPYLITGYTEKNSITFAANPNYWNPERVNVQYINWKYNDGTEATKSYTDAIAGDLSGAGLNSSALQKCKEEGYFDDYAYVSATDVTSFMGFFQVNRWGFANYNDETVGVSAKTDEQKELTRAALRNTNFRLAICQAFDRGTWMAQSVGEDLKYTSMTNAYVPGTFVYLDADVTVDVDGQSVTFPAGTAYGEILQTYLDADGYDIKVWDPNGNDGVGSGDGFDGWYNPDAAKAYMQQAVAEMAEYGIEISAENPVVIDYPAQTSSETQMNQANAFKQSIESVLDGMVQVQILEFPDRQSYNDATYWPDSGSEMNYDINLNSGWGPDFGDPSTYLSTFKPLYDGDMTKTMGIY